MPRCNKPLTQSGKPTGHTCGLPKGHGSTCSSRQNAERIAAELHEWFEANKHRLWWVEK